jgi:vitamin B12 transporter
MYCFHRSVGIGLLFFLLPVLVFSQVEPTTLSEVSLTAHGNRQPTRNTGRNIWIVPGHLLSRSPIHSIDDLLRFIPGVEVQQRGPQGAQGDLLIRGGTFQQVLVLIDGIRLNDPLTGHFNAYIPIDPLEIDRIEILKGPAAATWGSEAVGGVIQIITKTFCNKPAVRKKELQAGSTLGEYQSWQLQARGYAEHKNDRFSISGSSRNSDGAPQRGTRGYFQLHTVQGAWQHQFQKGWTFRMRTAWDERDFGAQNFYTGFVSDTATEQVNSWWNHAQLLKQLKKGSWQADLSYKQTLDVYRFRPTATPNRNEIGFTQFQLRYLRQTAAPFQYQIGLQAFQRSIRSNDRGDHQIEQVSAVSTGQYAIAKHWVAHGGLRITRDELYGNIVIPQVSLSQSGEKHQWRFSAGRSYRDADFTERYNNYNKSLVTSGRIGNPSLSPEDAWQMELGYDVDIEKKLFVHTSLFYRDQKGLIDWVTTPYASMPRTINLLPTGTYALAKNVERVKTTGWEMDLQYRDSLGSGFLLAQAGLLWLNNQAPSGGAGFYLNSHARFLLNGLIQYQWGPWIASTGLLYKKRPAQTATPLGAALTPSYFLWNAKLSYAPLGWMGSLFIQADNVLDTRYSDLLGAHMPGRWVSGGFRVTL